MKEFFKELREKRKKKKEERRKKGIRKDELEDVRI